jgi:hypothetical protein
MKQVIDLLDSLDDFSASLGGLNSVVHLFRAVQSSNISTKLILYGKNSRKAKDLIIKYFNDSVDEPIDTNFANPRDICISILFFVLSSCDPLKNDEWASIAKKAPNTYFVHYFINSSLLKAELERSETKDNS